MQGSAPKGVIAAYVWDCAGGMELMRHFWKEAGLTDVSTRTIDDYTVVTDFEDLWSPFLAGQGPAPTNRQFNECWNGYFFH
jgi:hypothetical protein